ncbi:NAD-dependent epimerase/dehydratase family protein [Herbidospora galbida]|uniref:NAD-dependent epimerase/dehydratase family protein n=1 Tax=Herbidospora galbida TaxID=2575442 RepID=A0A4U3M9W1_9ACTN|nr:NmrA family NAD(P)-binding protein [Herbidospora galbida]TKK85132.1 NAD-dependent epimerase/dehydratase family protein [Herbidospora galbida]
MTRILVTGATGNVGRPLVNRLLAEGHDVRALTRDPARAALPDGVEVVRGDLANPAGLFDGVTAAHLITFAGDPAAIAEAARGLTRVTLLQGSLTADPLEQALRAAGLRPTCLAPVEFMSNVLEWADSIKAEGVVRDGFAAMPSSMIHESDIADVAACALTQDGHQDKEYWLTGPEALTAPEKVAVLSKVLDREIRFEELTADQMVAVWTSWGFGEEDVAFMLQVRTDPPVQGRTVLPTVEEVTGHPARTFADWVQENAAAFR